MHIEELGLRQREGETMVSEGEVTGRAGVLVARNNRCAELLAVAGALEAH